MEAALKTGEWAKIQFRKRHIVVCITGHGFGHAVRVLQVAARMLETDPNLEFTIVTPVKEWLLRDTFRQPYRLLPIRLDFGTVQSNAISADPLATLQQYAGFILQRDEIFAELKDALDEQPIDLIISDIPPLASEMGAWLGVPTVGISNFSWDWIYDEYAALHPEYGWIIEEIRMQYGHTDLMLELPYAGDLSAFPRREPIPWICRRAAIAQSDVRKRLGIDPLKPIALVTFGGLGVEIKLPEGKWQNQIEFIVTAPVNRVLGDARIIENACLQESGVAFPDLLTASSVVVTKPGYGIVSECIAAKVPMLYAGRTWFREYPLLVNGMKRHLRCELLTPEMIDSGDWKPAFEHLFANRTQPPEPDPAINGDVVAAEAIFRILG